MIPRKLVDFEIKGSLPPERIAELRRQVARLATGYEVVVNKVETTGAPDPWEEFLELGYVSRDIIPDAEEEAYTISERSLRKILVERTDIEPRKVNFVWSGLSGHFIDRHDVGSRDTCDCPLIGYTNKPGSRVMNIVRFDPDSLIEMARLLHQDLLTNPKELGISPLATRGIIEVGEIFWAQKLKVETGMTGADSA